MSAWRARLATHGVWVLGAAAALIHLAQLAPDLEDVDSINFALGLREYDPGRHQPHPPGYPVYIALGRASLWCLHRLRPAVERTVVEAQALACWSALGIGLALVAVAALVVQLRRLAGARDDAAAAWTAGLMAVNALVWISGSRPLSDMPGLAIALGAQALLLRAVPGSSTGEDRGAVRLIWGAAVAGLAIGLRSQSLWLTGPLVLAAIAVQPRAVRWRRGALAMAAGAVACLLWAVPMVVASGGWSAYLAALGSQAGEDFTYIDMVYAHPSLKAVSVALYRTFVLPWGVDLRAPGTAGAARVAVQAVLVLAVAGVGRLLCLARREALWAAIAFVPYIVFHVTFQEAITVRYALPVVPLVVLLVVEGASWLGRARALPLAVAILWSASIALPHTRAYAATPGGAAQAVQAMATVAESTPPALLATHIQLARPVQAADVPGGNLLPPRMTGNWLALADYWTAGGTETVWFLADPRRHDLDSIDPSARQDVSRFPWAVAAFPELSGVRPTDADWYRLRPPAWVVGEGWALSPETGGLTAATGTGPHARPVRAWVRRQPGAARVMVGGRFLTQAAAPATVRLALDGRVVERWSLTPEPDAFLHWIDLPAGALDGDGAYATLTVSVDPATGPVTPVALTQFRAGDPSALMWGLGEGWHDDEVDARTGERFRWSAGRATIAVRGAAAGVRVRIAVAPPRQTSPEPPTIRLLAGDAVLASAASWAAVTLDATVDAGVLAAAGGALTLETSHTFSPSERDGSPDRRRLGLRVVGIDISRR